MKRKEQFAINPDSGIKNKFGFISGLESKDTVVAFQNLNFMRKLVTIRAKNIDIIFF